MKKSLLFCFIMISIALFTSCESKHTPKAPTVLSDIAYKNSDSANYTVYLLENNTYVPYLVVTENYDGNCLLLRQNCLDTPMTYNPVDTIKPSYYEDCQIDVFLNTDYKKCLSDYTNNSLVDVDLIITTENSIGRCGNDLSTIKRNIFLLSLEELGYADGRILLMEGHELTYFKDKNNCIAATDSGALCQWYLRTPDTWGEEIISYIDIDGTYGTTGVTTIKGDTMNYIRPALCLPKDTPIYKITINEQNVYAIE